MQSRGCKQDMVVVGIQIRQNSADATCFDVIKQACLHIMWQGVLGLIWKHVVEGQAGLSAPSCIE